MSELYHLPSLIHPGTSMRRKPYTSPTPPNPAVQRPSNIGCCRDMCVCITCRCSDSYLSQQYNPNTCLCFGWPLVASQIPWPCPLTHIFPQNEPGPTAQSAPVGSETSAFLRPPTQHQFVQKGTPGKGSGLCLVSGTSRAPARLFLEPKTPNMYLCQVWSTQCVSVYCGISWLGTHGPSHPPGRTVGAVAVAAASDSHCGSQIG